MSNASYYTYDGFTTQYLICTASVVFEIDRIAVCDMAYDVDEINNSINQSLLSTLQQRQQVGDSRGEPKNPNMGMYLAYV